MIEVVGRGHAQVRGLQTCVHIDASWDHNVPIGIHCLHTSRYDEVLANLPTSQTNAK